MLDTEYTLPINFDALEAQYYADNLDIFDEYKPEYGDIVEGNYHD